MNGIENISNRILDEAKEKARLILEEAGREAQRIEADGRAKADAELDIIRKAGSAKVADIEEKARLNSAMETRKIISAEKQALIQSAFDKALEHLLALPQDEYVELLAKLAANACADGQPGELLLSARDLAACGESVLKSAKKLAPNTDLTLSSDTAAIRGGLVIRRGKVEINCALEVSIRMLQEEISGEVATCLFGKGA